MPYLVKDEAYRKLWFMTNSEQEYMLELGTLVPGEDIFPFVVMEYELDGYNVAVCGSVSTLLVAFATDSGESEFWKIGGLGQEWPMVLYMISRWTKRMMDRAVLGRLGFHQVDTAVI